MSIDSIISKFCAFCTTLRDEGIGYGDYPKQIPDLILFRMAGEYSLPTSNRAAASPP